MRQAATGPHAALDGAGRHLHATSGTRTNVHMNDIDLTPNQQRVLACIEAWFEQFGHAPTLREIAHNLGLASHTSAQDYVAALVRKGVLERLPHHRGLRLPHRSRALAATSLPLVGRVAAGSPILAQEHIDQTYLMEASMFPRRPDYLLKVRGMSMRDAGIIDGDLLAVQKAKDAKNGQIVVARLGDDVTVKRFRRTRTSIELIPENPDFATIVVPFGDVDFELEGVAVGLIRNNMMM